MGGLLHLVQRGEDWTRHHPVQVVPLLAVPNVTAHPSTANEPIAVLLYGGPLLSGFNLVIKGLRRCRRSEPQNLLRGNNSSDIVNCPTPEKTGNFIANRSRIRRQHTE